MGRHDNALVGIVLFLFVTSVELGQPATFFFVELGQPATFFFVGKRLATTAHSVLETDPTQ